MNETRKPVTVVTGGASGIGLACVRHLFERGDKVVVLDLPDAKLPDDIVRAGIRSVGCDVASEMAVSSAVETIEREYGPVELLVNSAGVIQARLEPERLDMQTWDKVIAIDQRGTYLCCVAFGRLMAKRGRGSIVNIASITGSASVPLHAYAPAKAAVISITRCLAAEWGRSGVRVNSVSPGYTVTPALQAAIDRGDRNPDDLTRPTAMGRMVKAEEVAAVVGFLLSSAASAVTGVDLPVDAGWTVGTPWQSYGGVPAARVAA